MLVPYCSKSDCKVCPEGRCSLQWRCRHNEGHISMWNKKDVVYPHTLSEDEDRREKKRTRTVVKKNRCAECGTWIKLGWCTGISSLMLCRSETEKDEEVRGRKEGMKKGEGISWAVRGSVQRRRRLTENREK